jgi:hypothetical protein
MELLGNPDKITFVIKPRKRVEIVVGEVQSEEASENE